MLQITLFADFTCPFSYLAEMGLRRIPGEVIQVRHRAYELFPEPTALEPLGLTDEVWRMLDSHAREIGLEMSRPVETVRTRKAHEASRFARERGLEDELRREIYSAYWVEGLDIGRIDVLAGLAGRIGFDPEDLKVALDIDRFEEPVRHDQEIARRLGIPGTPTIYLGTGRDARVLVGAQPPGELARLVREKLHRDETTPDV